MLSVYILESICLLPANGSSPVNSVIRIQFLISFQVQVSCNKMAYIKRYFKILLIFCNVRRLFSRLSKKNLPVVACSERIWLNLCFLNFTVCCKTTAIIWALLLLIPLQEEWVDCRTALGLSRNWVSCTQSPRNCQRQLQKRLAQLLQKIHLKKSFEFWPVP